MAKNRALFRCTACGHEEPKWMGRCPECGEWNSFREESPHQLAARAGGAGGIGGGGRNLSTLPLTAVDPREGTRMSAGTDEMNRVLGGGIMRGSS